MRRTDIEKPQFLIDGLAALRDFHARAKTGDPKFRARRQLRQDLMAPKFLQGYIGPAAQDLDILGHAIPRGGGAAVHAHRGARHHAAFGAGG